MRVHEVRAHAWGACRCACGCWAAPCMLPLCQLLPPRPAPAPRAPHPLLVPAVALPHHALLRVHLARGWVGTALLLPLPPCIAVPPASLEPVVLEAALAVRLGLHGPVVDQVEALLLRGWWAVGACVHAGRAAARRGLLRACWQPPRAAAAACPPTSSFTKKLNTAGTWPCWYRPAAATTAFARMHGSAPAAREPACGPAACPRSAHTPSTHPLLAACASAPLHGRRHQHRRGAERRRTCPAHAPRTCKLLVRAGRPVSGPARALPLAEGRERRVHQVRGAACRRGSPILALVYDRHAVCGHWRRLGVPQCRNRPQQADLQKNGECVFAPASFPAPCAPCGSPEATLPEATLRHGSTAGPRRARISTPLLAGQHHPPACLPLGTAATGRALHPTPQPRRRPCPPAVWAPAWALG